MSSPELATTPKIGVYVCDCGINISGKVDVAAVVEFVCKLPGVTAAREYKFMCSDPGQDLIVQDIKEGCVDRIVVASCSPLMHEATFRRAVEAAGENPFCFQMANIREHVSWVTEDSQEATRKAKALVAAAVVRVGLHKPLERKRVRVHPDVMVVGGGIAGIQAALTMADSGKHVYLIEREPAIGGHMAQFDKTFPTLDCAACILTPKMTQVRAHPNIELLTYAEVEGVDGYVGNFKVKVRKKARFVREDLCTGCNACTEVCPVEVRSEFDEGLAHRKAIYRPFPQAVPNVFTISRKGLPPCQAACALHQNAQGYVTLIAQGKYREAMDVVLRDNPLPSVCGRICTHPCTAECTRMKVDDPLNIPGLKRFVADYVLGHEGGYHLPRPQQERTEKVAIVGAGPSGLMCAYELRQRGYQTVVFESLPMAGGMLAAGIPAFRLPRHALRREIDNLEEIGVRLRLNQPIGRHGIPLETLMKQYDAVYLAIGAHVERKMRVSGEDLPGVWGGIDFLRRINMGELVTLGRRVLVIGGGNSAIDAARTSRRHGAEEVRVMYRRTRAEMPADPAEIEEAMHEGITIEFLVAPHAIRRSPAGLDVELIRMQLGELDDSGRPRPVPITGSEFTTACDAVIATIGQVPDMRSLGDQLGLETTTWGTIQADPMTLATTIPGVFAGGDCVTGPDVVVTAMAGGRKAAISIDRYINAQDMRAGRELEGAHHSHVEVDTAGVLMRKRVPMPAIPIDRRRTFDEVHTGYTEEMARSEAARCLDCAVCCDCELCATACEPKAIDYTMKDTLREVDVGAIVLATGFKTFDARRTARYGYGRYPNVFTSLEVERLVNASGPTGGEIRMRDGRAPKSVGIIHCVGSRDELTNRYCSRVCCMYSLKLAHLVKERTGAEVYNFYIDIRAAGKGYEEFYDKLLKEGVHFIRGRAAEVTDWAMNEAEEGRLVIRAEDTLIGVVRRVPVDMVVLAVGLEAQSDAEQVRRTFNISCSKEGWFLERHPKLAPVSTYTDGVFLAGACQGPKDIPDSVAQAGAAAAEAMVLVDRGYIELEPNTACVNEEACSGCKTCVSLCPYRAISLMEEKKKALINEALCKGCGVCVAACPSGSITQNLFEDEQIFQEIGGLLSYA
ncbi:MAG: FAD-dependent oxidoreductase [Acidobacteria bacterium]|nr:FAD-dependent oxidoreductase [Acidobacteriota bacterium]